MPQPRFMQEQNLKDMLKNYAWQQEHKRICSQITPNINEIKRLLNKKNELYFPTEPDTNALELKLKAMTAIPNTIEKTMTPYQLYQSQNILWARSLPAKTIEFMTRAKKEIGSISETDFKEICRCKNNLAFHSFIKERTKPCH